MIKSFLVLAITFLITYVLFHVLFKDLKLIPDRSEVGPYNTVIDYYCTRMGVEYFVTNHGYMILHVDPHGKPVLCQTFKPLAEN